MSQATQGQHLRLQFGAAANSKAFAAYSTDLTFHVSNTLENSTTKDTTDGAGDVSWIEQEKTKHNIDGSIVAIMDEGEAQNFTDASQAGEQVWELDWISGNQNRVVSNKICSGDKMLLSNVEISAPRDGFCQLTGNFVIFGAISFI
jgi:hypothetical protein